VRHEAHSAEIVMTRFLSWLFLIVLLGAFGAAVYYTLRTQASAGKGMPAYSVYSDDADGLAETARLLRKLGWEPVAVTRPIEHTRHRGLLIVVEPENRGLTGQPSPPSAEELDGMLRWVEEGNTLWLCSRHIRALRRGEQLHVEVLPQRPSADDKIVQRVVPDDAGGYTEEIDHLAIEGANGVDTNAGLPLWQVGEKPGAVLLRHGKGRILAVADPSLLTRRGLSREDNVMFLVNVARLDAEDGRVYFDEYHHGLQGGGGFWDYLRYHGEHWTMLEVLLVLVVAGWTMAVRLGPPVPTPRTRQADAVDYASAVARIYYRAGVGHLMAKALVRDFLGALTRHLRLRRTALPAEILAAWRKQQPAKPSRSPLGDADPSRRLADLLRAAVELRRRTDVPDLKLLAWAKSFDRFKDEVLRAH
jgi:hypothetical protein